MNCLPLFFWHACAGVVDEPWRRGYLQEQERQKHRGELQGQGARGQGEFGYMESGHATQIRGMILILDYNRPSRMVRLV